MTALAGSSRLLFRLGCAPRPMGSRLARSALATARPAPTTSLLSHSPRCLSTSGVPSPRYYSSPPRSISPDEEEAMRKWMRNMQAKQAAQEERDHEATWNKYGRKEPIKSWWRPIVFTLGFGVLSYSFAAAWTNTDTQKWMEAVMKRPLNPFRTALPSDNELLRAKRQHEAKIAQETLKNLPSVLSFLPDFLLVPVLRTYIMYQENRINMKDGYRAQIDILTVLGVVFIGWRLPSTSRFVYKWFLHNPIAWTRRQDWRNSFTMLTSTFSHQDLAHLAFNSIALYGFGSAAYMFLATPSPDVPSIPSSTHTPHFLAFFALAGIVSSLGAHLTNNLIRLPRLLRALRSPAQLSPTNALAAHYGIKPSLGASGAVYACVTMTALAYPDSGISLIFLPMFTFPISAGVLGMVCIDILGIIRGWRSFDHIAHLCGALFGVFYYFEGRQMWASCRRAFGAIGFPGYRNN